MEKLRAYLKSLGSDEARKAFAKRCSTSLKYLRNASYGFRTLGPEICVNLERESDGALSRRDLRPDDWVRIWPELAPQNEAAA